MTPPAAESPQHDPVSTTQPSTGSTSFGSTSFGSTIAIALKSRAVAIMPLLLRGSLILGLAMLWVLLSAKTVR